MSDVDNEIQEITSEKSDEVIELKKELETAKKKINSLNDQNSIFRDRITAQAKELMYVAYSPFWLESCSEKLITFID